MFILCTLDIFTKKINIHYFLFPQRTEIFTIPCYDKFEEKKHIYSDFWNKSQK